MTYLGLIVPFKGVARVELFVIARGSASGVKAAAHVGNLSPLGV